MLMGIQKFTLLIQIHLKELQKDQLFIISKVKNLSILTVNM